VFAEEDIRSEISLHLRGFLGADGARTVEELIDSALRPAEGVIPSVIATLVVLFGSTQVFFHLKRTLDAVWNIPPRAGRSDVLLFLRDRFWSLVLALIVGFLLVVSTVMSALLTAISQYSSAVIPHRTLVSLAMTAALFTVVYKVLPDVDLRWRDVWVGGLVTAVLFAAGEFAIGLYLARAAATSAYGAAGSLLVILAWMYYAALVFLLGAQFTFVYSHRTQRRPVDHWRRRYW
jgi:membrane protein